MENHKNILPAIAELSLADNSYGKLAIALGEFALAEKALHAFMVNADNGELPKSSLGDMENALTDSHRQAQFDLLAACEKALGDYSPNPFAVHCENPNCKCPNKDYHNSQEYRNLIKGGQAKE